MVKSGNISEIYDERPQRGSKGDHGAYEHENHVHDAQHLMRM